MNLHFPRPGIYPLLAMMFVSGCDDGSTPDTNEPPSVSLLDEIPEPTPPPTPTPEAVVVLEKPEPEPESAPAPEPAATPEPEKTAQGVDWEKVCADKNLWPPSVRVKREVTIPVVMDGKTIGQVRLPRGSIVQLEKVTMEGVTIAQGTHRTEILASDTTLEEQLMALAESGTPSPDSNTSTAAISDAVRPAPASPPTASIPPRAPLATSSTGMVREFKDVVKVEVVRQKRARIEGGDYDDKIERVALRIKLHNSDTNNAFANLTAKICIFGESTVKRGTHRLHLVQSFPVSNLPPREDVVLETREIESGYDTTGAKWGYKYSGWILQIKNASGEVLYLKSTSPSWELAADSLDSLKELSHYDRKLEEQKGPARLRIY